MFNRLNLIIKQTCHPVCSTSFLTCMSSIIKNATGLSGGSCCLRTMASNMHKINFNTKHLKKGDKLPPFNGKLRIYNMRYCPYAQRTILALNAKNIDYEVININLIDKPEWLTTKSAFAKVPALEIEDGVTLCESLITVEYLDDAYPQTPLMPRNALRKAHDKMIVEATAPMQSAFVKQIRQLEFTEDNLNAYHQALAYVQNELLSRGTKFLAGDEPGYVDYMIWPWFERIVMLKEVFPKLLIDPVQYKVLNTYCGEMLSVPAVSCYLVNLDVMKKLLEGYKPGNVPDYDILLENDMSS